MQCPYCEGEMIPGKLGATGYNVLQWNPDKAESKIKHLLGFESEVFGMHLELKAHRCNGCDKIIIDLLDSYNKNTD